MCCCTTCKVSCGSDLHSSVCTDTCAACVQLDPEFKATVDLIRSGMFGYEDFFSDVLDSITHGSDYYLLANDFQSYIKAQVTAAPLK